MKNRACGHRRRRNRRRWDGRRGAARRHRPWRCVVEFVLACGDFRDRGIERGRADRRRRAIDLGGVDLGCRALDHLGLPLLVLQLGASRRRIRDLRQPRIETGDRVVQLAGNGGLVGCTMPRRIIARGHARNLLDLAGDEIQPLVDVGDVGGLRPRDLHRCALRGTAKIGRGGFTESGIEPVVQGHTGAMRGGLGPVAHGWINAVNTPRNARIHALIRFRLGAVLAPCSLPARPN